MLPRGDSLSAWDLEQYLIPTNKWKKHLKNIPKEQQQWLQEDGGGPIGLGKHPKFGYFINISGQGPATIWAEWELNDN